VTTEPTYAALRDHNTRVQRMLTDPECVGELLLVGIGMARCLDLDDPHWAPGKGMPLKPIAYAVYGRYRQAPNMLLPDWGKRGDSHPRQRILDVFFHDRRRYSASVDGDVGPHGGTQCGRPMQRREGLCGRSASWDQKRRLADPVTGRRHTVGACSQPKCRAWFADLLARNAAELAANPAPEPPANTGGVLERHLPEIDWWKVWRHVDSQWTPPPEGRAFERPRLTVLINDDDTEPGAVVTRPTLVALEGGWR
jgi:hypothetical protein